MKKKKDVVKTYEDSAYLKRLKEEREALELRIKDLQVEVRTINNLIYREKSKMLAVDNGETQNLKNADRLFFETVIIDALRASPRGLRTSEICGALAKKGYAMNYNTLRTYVTKMRDKALIQKKSPRSYYWIASSPRPTPPVQP